MEIADTNFWFEVAKDPILSRNTQIRKTSTLKMTSLTYARVCSRQHFRGLQGKGFPTDSRHSNWHKLCPSSSRHFFCTHTKRTSYSLCSQLERKSKHLSSTSHTDISMTYCQSITQILRIIWVRCTPLNLRFKKKTRQRATPLLPTCIYSCRSEGAVSCALPFTTKGRRFQLPYHKLSVSEQQYSIFTSLWCFNPTAHTVCQGLLFL